MAVGEIKFRGEALGMWAAMNVILPDKGKGPFPVYYLLHGLTDDHGIWSRWSSIERYVAGLPLIVVMPSTARQWYTNSVNRPGLRYEDHIIKDVVGLVDRTFPTIANRRGRAIGGLSMGGYGAMKLALKYPDLFCAANSHSGAVVGVFDGRRNIRAGKPSAEEAAEFDSIFGTGCEGGPEDPLALARKCPKSKRPKLRIDCGVDDFLLDGNRMFHAHLDKIGYKHEYEEFPGAHDWNYWDLHIQDALAFHRRVLGV